MISFTTGEIQLSHSKYILSPSLDRLNFEKTFPNKIINYYDSHTGCYHYCVACDIRKNEYIKTSICFHNQVMWYINFFPQNSARNMLSLEIVPIDNYYEVAYPACKKWYKTIFSADTAPLVPLVFPWGIVKIIPGDPKDTLFQPHISMDYYGVCDLCGKKELLFPNRIEDDRGVRCGRLCKSCQEKANQFRMISGNPR